LLLLRNEIGFFPELLL